MATGLTKPVRASQALARVIGATNTTRVDITRGLWAYIKEHKLQDPARKTVIRCDENLQAIMGKNEINQTELLKLVQPHIEKLEGDKPATPKATKAKPKLQ